MERAYYNELKVTLETIYNKITKIFANNDEDKLIVKSNKVVCGEDTDFVSFYIYKKTVRKEISSYDLLMIIECKKRFDTLTLSCFPYGQLVRYENRTNTQVKRMVEYTKIDKVYDDTIFDNIDCNIRYCNKYVGQIKTKKTKN